MNLCLLTLAFALACSPAHDQDPDPVGTADHWIGEDKLRHFSLSFAATQMGYGGARVIIEPGPAVPVAAGAALALGLAKEIADLRAGKPFSFEDLAWDAAGVALGIVMIRNVR